MTSCRRLGLCVAHAAATFFAFPQMIAGLSFDFGLFFAWLVPLTLLCVVKDLSFSQGLRWGFFAGVLAQTALLHWIYVATVNYGGAHPIVGMVSVSLLACYGAALGALFAAGSRLFGTWNCVSPVALAALWVATDWLRSVILTGFPWGTLGYALHDNTWLMPLVPYTGVYGLSFAAALGSTALWFLWIGSTARAFIPCLALVIFHVIGAVWLSTELHVEGPRVRVAVLQGNIDQGLKWDRANSDHILSIYKELTEQAVARGAVLVVWPETAVPGLPEANPAIAENLSSLARKHGITLVVGAVGLNLPDRISDVPSGRPKFFDSAFVFGPDGRYQTRYDKSHLVPFGEYVPLRRFTGRFITAVANGVATDDVTAGLGPRALHVPLRDHSELSVGVPICYELLFPDLVRRFASDGAGLLLAITNDAWYGRTGAPYQFLEITALRAAETRLWIARAANSGVSALIDARGRVVRKTAIFEQGVLVEDVPIQAIAVSDTFYVRYGDVFVAVCVFFLLSVGVWTFVYRRM